MKTSTIVALNVLGWPVLQLSIARAFTIMPDRLFVGNNPLTRVRPREPALYRTVCHIHAWKLLLPDGGLWVGGRFAKRHIVSHDPDYLRHFALETRRSELAHWSMVLCFPLFYLWNPPWARLLMTVYALGVNLPCILTQRYNRARIERIAENTGKRLRRTSSAEARTSVSS